MADGGGKGISGVAVAMMTTGAFLMYIGIKNVGFLDGMRSILSGEIPEGPEPDRTEVELELPTYTVTPGESESDGPGSVMT